MDCAFAVVHTSQEVRRALSEVAVVLIPLSSVQISRAKNREGLDTAAAHRSSVKRPH